MKRQFKATPPEEIHKIITETLIVDTELMTEGLSKATIIKIVEHELGKAHNELAPKMLKQLNKFKSTGNEQLDSNILNQQVLVPLIEKARERILHKLICNYPLAVEKRLKADGFGIENSNNKKYIENLGEDKNEKKRFTRD